MLKEAIKSGYKIANFKNHQKFKNAKQVILLRHDIDSQPRRHLEIAKIEKSLGISSTFFVRVHGEYYGVFDQENYKIIKKIAQLGHEIGLHSEARTYSTIYKEDPKNIFLKEKAILEQIIGKKIVSASEHAPLDRPENFWENHLFKRIGKNKLGIIYHPFDEELRKFHYLSDSLGKWREGCFCENLNKYDKIQLLVHADIWGKGAIADLIKIDKRLKKYVKHS